MVVNLLFIHRSGKRRKFVKRVMIDIVWEWRLMDLCLHHTSVFPCYSARVSGQTPLACHVLSGQWKGTSEALSERIPEGSSPMVGLFLFPSAFLLYSCQSI